MSERRLTNRMRAFVEAYLQCWNASEAARRAGYRTRPNVAGPRLLVNDSIQTLIEERLAEASLQTDEILARLSEQARAEYAAYLGADGKFDLARMLADGKGRLIKRLQVRKDGRLCIEFHDAQAALIQLARHYGLFVDKVALTDPTGAREYGDYREALGERLDRVANELAKQNETGQG